MLTSLDDTRYQQGLQELARRQAVFADILLRLGAPPLRVRGPGLPTLVGIVLEQQVTTAVGQLLYERLLAQAGAFSAARLLELSDEQYRAVGISRQKTATMRALAARVAAGALDLDRLGERPDDEVRDAITAIKGLGRWSADCYLLFGLGRSDAWPSGDLGLQLAVQWLWALPERPRPATLDQLAEGWSPWRSVAARLLWHDYIDRQRRGRGT